MPRRIAVAWVDLIIAALVTVCGAGLWAATEDVVTFVLRDDAPDKQEFLARNSVRVAELRLRTVQEELDAARKKWIEQRLGGVTPDLLGPGIPKLEKAQIVAERSVADARREALRDFEREDLKFTYSKRALAVLFGILAAIVGALAIYGVGSSVAKSLGLRPAWRAAMALASLILAPIFGYGAAGGAGAAVALILVLLIVSLMSR
jgi:hypothetical protein